MPLGMLPATIIREVEAELASDGSGLTQHQTQRIARALAAVIEKNNQEIDRELGRRFANIERQIGRR
jgi:hypothetical protein